MAQITTKIKKWGNSLGVILPKKTVEEEKLKEGSEISIFIQQKNITRVKDIFGLLKGKIKRSTQEILDEVDKDFYPQDYE